MPEFTAHLPGTFNWPELATTDQKAAVTFYCALFGWTVVDVPIGPDGTYAMFQMAGRDVAAAYTMRAEERHGPPRWNAYITVESADEAASRARTLGGTVIAEPFDVWDQGRMAVIQDPTGAMFEVWQPRKSIGAGVLYEPGALCWTELTTSDPDAAEAFYTALFGWVPKHSAPGASMPYTEFTVSGADAPSVGMMPKPPHLPADVPSYWMPYFQVTDVDAAAERAQALGGRIYFGPHDIPDAGRFVVMGDPQGAVFAMFQMGS